ncbi:MAG: lipoyl(octanoyl) transferase LipB [Elainellaceae cyanobacterium]
MGSDRPTLCLLYCPGQIDYQIAWSWQRSLLNQRRQNPDLPDLLLLLEHPPTYTLGQGSSLEFLKFDPQQSDIALFRTERGGEVTYHGPGQLVGYPILNLRRHRPDLHWYLRQLEEVIIRAIAPWGLRGAREAGLTGVWVNGEKMAAIGIKASRWITMHGFAINVCPSLAAFENIVPCGIGDRSVGSLQRWVSDIEVGAVRQSVCRSFEEVFDLQLQEVPELNLSLDLLGVDPLHVSHSLP